MASTSSLASASAGRLNSCCVPIIAVALPQLTNYPWNFHLYARPHCDENCAPAKIWPVESLGYHQVILILIVHGFLIAF
jgi:hypothetical protein